jgi:hypothetical protein
MADFGRKRPNFFKRFKAAFRGEGRHYLSKNLIYNRLFTNEHAQAVPTGVCRGEMGPEKNAKKLKIFVAAYNFLTIISLEAA